MKIEITDEMVRKATIALQKDGYLHDAVEAVAPIIADQVLERVREQIRPLSPRPCDCEDCHCGRRDEATAVAAWDTRRDIDDAIRALKEPTP